jgi:hypothetical protein
VTLSTLCEEDLAGVDIFGARELVVRCFFNAQRETLERMATQRGPPPSDAELQQIVVGAVRLSFRQTGGDFEHPTPPTLRAAVQSLAERSAAMGTPRDIIEHHRGQLERLFMALG